ncbi:MAG: NYN domain-containing protein [Acidobacteriia bacterium]|nr:NYN domain-containing protein [Terriglobia bacterium]
MPYWLDGNNLIGQSAAAARQDPKTRKSFLALLSSFAATRGGRFTVFFDGDDPDRAAPPRGVRVRYSAPLSTDNAILRQAEGAQAPVEVIVVTNDRGLAARCRSAGVKTMDWRQFTDRMTAGPRASGKAAPKEEKVDLEEWARYFGLDPDTLK